MPVENSAAETPPDGFSRRRLMCQAAAVGAAGLAANMLSGTAVADAAAADDRAVGPAEPHAPAEHDEPLIVHVRDVRTGHLDLFSGDRHHRVQDPELAASLVRALG
jgi:nitrous oxide reductase